MIKGYTAREEKLGMWTRAELKDNAKKFFKFNYWKMVLVALIMSFIGGGGGGGASFNYSQNANNDDLFGFSRMSDAEAMTFFLSIMVVVLVIWIIAGALSIFLFNPLTVGAERFFVVSHYQKADLNELGFAFSNSYMNVVKTMFLRSLYVFLWSLLFVIPGIIKAYEYLMIPYILAENPGIDSKEAFAMSKQMMDGNKWKAFVLRLSFLGWIFLSIFTCGILAVFYVNPYMLMTEAELYVALKEITFGNRGQGGYQNMYQPNAQWDNNNQWNNNQQYNNDQWNSNNQQYNNDQWNSNNQQYNNNQWNNGQPVNNGQWNNSQSTDNSQWNNNQPVDNNPWDNKPM